MTKLITLEDENEQERIRAASEIAQWIIIVIKKYSGEKKLKI